MVHLAFFLVLGFWWNSGASAMFWGLFEIIKM
jgi:hypothetical protein